MKKFRSSLLALFVALSSLCSCTVDTDIDQPAKTGNDQPYYENIKPLSTDRNITFTESELSVLRQLDVMAFEFHKAVRSGAGNANDTYHGNYNFSPVSAAICFAMLTNSIDEPNRTAMARSLGFNDADQMAGVATKLLTYLPAEGLGVDISLVNSVWSANTFMPNNEFVALMNNTFGAPVNSLDFSDMPFAIKTINQWCDDNTGGLIKEVISELPANTVAVWVNALHFVGKWSCEFNINQTSPAVFNSLDGPSTIDMMHQQCIMHYSRLENAEMISLLFDGEAYSLDLILSDDAAFDLSTYKQLLGDEKQCIVDFSLPRFEITYLSDLCEVFPQLADKANDASLSTMGIPLIYSLSNLKAVQKSSLVVNEKGAEGAAATVVSGEISTAPDNASEYQKIEIVFDRPFSYVLRNRDKDIILFIGQINNL